jgi:hypothetical protein
MPAIEPPHMDTRDFNAVRDELCRLLIARKADLGLSDRADTEIEARIDDIVLFLAARVGAAQITGDQRFMERFGWLIEAFQRLDEGDRTVPLDS